MDHEGILFPQLKSKSRKQIIEIATKEIQKALPDVDLAPYRDVQVWKTSQYVRVIFDANISVDDQIIHEKSDSPVRYSNIGSSITFRSTEKNVWIEPKESKFLFKYTPEILSIAKTFKIGDRLSFEDKGDAFQVRVSHPSTKGETGGSEVYLINKTTLKREIIQHEHPQPLGAMGVITDRNGNPYVDPNPEVEVLD